MILSRLILKIGCSYLSFVVFEPYVVWSSVRLSRIDSSIFSDCGIALSRTKPGGGTSVSEL